MAGEGLEEGYFLFKSQKFVSRASIRFFPDDMHRQTAFIIIPAYSISILKSESSCRAD